MQSQTSPSETPAAIAAVLSRLSPDYAPTPLLDLPRLAQRLGVAQVLAKDEGRRRLGSFKSLGGTYAGLRALARQRGTDIDTLIAERPDGQPHLICASDGNHGLAVAAAARFAGTRACVFLHSGVPEVRANRIVAEGADIEWVQGTYDDAVDAAAIAAKRQGGILVADTTDAPHDPIVADVMAGYGVIAHEARLQIAAMGYAMPNMMFVQAGVGGLAAAMAEGFGACLTAPGRIVAVEPDRARAVAAGLEAGRAVRIAGTLDTSAEMLSCGEASAPALAILQRHHVEAIGVSEQVLEEAAEILHACGGPRSTPSGAAGLAGALSVGRDALGPDARLMLVISEAALA